MQHRDSDNQRLLRVFQETPNTWLANLYSLNLILHSRCSDLRKKGHTIECKKFGPKDYRYRLVVPVREEECSFA